MESGQDTRDNRQHLPTENDILLRRVELIDHFDILNRLNHRNEC